MVYTEACFTVSVVTSLTFQIGMQLAEYEFGTGLRSLSGYILFITEHM